MTDIIDEVFNGEIEDHEEVGEAPAKTQEIEEPEGEKSEPEKDEDEAEPPAAEDEVEEKSVPVAALKSERQKRQAAETELNELKKKIAPEEEEDVDEAVFIDRVDISREVLMEAFPDYEEKEAVFFDLAKDNKQLRMQLRQSKNPAKFAYEKAKEHLEIEEIKQVKSSDDWSAFQQWKKEQKNKPVEDTPEVKRNKSVLAVPNLNKATAKGSNSSPVQSLPELDEIFEDSPF